MGGVLVACLIAGEGETPETEVPGKGENLTALLILENI